MEVAYWRDQRINQLQTAGLLVINVITVLNCQHLKHKPFFQVEHFDV